MILKEILVGNNCWKFTSSLNFPVRTSNELIVFIKTRMKGSSQMKEQKQNILTIVMMKTATIVLNPTNSNSNLGSRENSKGQT